MCRNSDKLGAPRVTPAMWEQRQYEIARDIYAHSMQENYLSPDEAVKKADRLIDALKKPKQ